MAQGWSFAFQQPYWFLLFPPVAALMIWWALRRRKRTSQALTFSSLEVFRNLGPQPSLRWRHVLLILRLLTVFLLIAALARPQAGRKNSLLKSEGIDVMITLDISDSMQGEDFHPDHRLAVAKRVAADFVGRRVNDRLGLVVFGSQAYLQCPLTLDHDVLQGLLSRVQFVPEVSRATAIGMGVSTSLLALRKSKAKSKVIVLITDGVNNAGEIDPVTAGELAKSQGVKVYTIGIGKPGVYQVLITVQDPDFGPRKVPVQVEMDEEPLRQIARTTGGQYFNAMNSGRLSEIMKEIDRLEKTEITTRQYLEVREYAWSYLALALLFLMAEIILSQTRLRTLP